MAITGGKSGVGRNCFAVNFALALRTLNLRVLVIDTDIGDSNIDKMLGSSGGYGFSHYAAEENSLEDVTHTGHRGIRILRSGAGLIELKDMPQRRRKQVIEELSALENTLDVLVLKAGAGITDTGLQLVGAAAETIVVTTPDPKTILDAYALIKTVVRKQPDNKPGMSVIMNRAQSAQEAENAMRGFKNIIKKYLQEDVRYLGDLPQSDINPASLTDREPLILSDPRHPFSEAVMSAAREFILRTAENGAKKPISKFFETYLA